MYIFLCSAWWREMKWTGREKKGEKESRKE